ncbi:MAG: hypothetical protein WAM82_33910, partial [Thermoanaerobaculia bacterium]
MSDRSDSKILQQLSEIGAQMASGQPPKAVFSAIVDAVQSLGFDRVRLDLVSPDGSSISLAAQRGFEGMEAEEPAPTSQDPDLMALLSEPCPQVTGTGDRGLVPLVLREAVIGKLTVDRASSGRPVSRAELDAAVLFANQAAIAISLTNASFLQNDEDKLQRLERLAQSTRELMGNLDGMSLQERLMLIARYSAEILQAETSGVFRVRDGEIVLEAGYGQEGEFVPGLARRIHNEERGGLTGYIAYHGKLFNAKGEELKS